MPTLLADPKEFETVTQAGDLSVVHFSADFAAQCPQVDDLLDTLAKHPDYSKVKFYKCQAEDLNDISLKHNITAAPTVILFKSGKSVERIEGADAAKITEKIQKQTGSAAGATAPPASDLPLEERLKSLINKAKVMLFMKGDRDTPRCGFSRQIIQILNSAGVNYETFDILTDEEVRQGLKTYSDWPTYPQLYIKGDLIGGLDIVKEMQASGELASALNA